MSIKPYGIKLFLYFICYHLSLWSSKSVSCLQIREGSSSSLPGCWLAHRTGKLILDCLPSPTWPLFTHHEGILSSCFFSQCCMLLVAGEEAIAGFCLEIRTFTFWTVKDYRLSQWLKLFQFEGHLGFSNVLLYDRFVCFQNMRLILARVILSYIPSPLWSLFWNRV